MAGISLVETQFKYNVGQVVRELASSGQGVAPRKLVVARRGYFEGQPAYILNEADTGNERGWFSEDMIEPYRPTGFPGAEDQGGGKSPAGGAA